jgi:hypothetical protein
MDTTPGGIDTAGWWWKGHALGYGEAVNDADLMGRHGGHTAQVPGLADLEFEDWWDGYSSGWVEAARDPDREGTR